MISVFSEIFRVFPLSKTKKLVAILTAIGSTLSVTTAASGAPAEGVALLGGTIVGTGWLHHLSTLV